MKKKIKKINEYLMNQSPSGGKKREQDRERETDSSEKTRAEPYIHKYKLQIKRQI